MNFEKELHLSTRYEVTKLFLRYGFSSRKWKQWACKPTFLGPHPSPFGRPVLKNPKTWRNQLKWKSSCCLVFESQVCTAQAGCHGQPHNSRPWTQKLIWKSALSYVFHFLSVVHQTGSPHPNQECETSQEGEAPERISTLEDIVWRLSGSRADFCTAHHQEQDRCARHSQALFWKKWGPKNANCRETPSNYKLLKNQDRFQASQSSANPIQEHYVQLKAQMVWNNSESDLLGQRRKHLALTWLQSHLITSLCSKISKSLTPKGRQYNNRINFINPTRALPFARRKLGVWFHAKHMFISEHVLAWSNAKLAFLTAVEHRCMTSG